MNHLKYYQDHLQIYQSKGKALNKQITMLSTLRLLIFLAFGYAVYYFFNTWMLALGIGAVGIVTFLFLLSKFTNIKRMRDFTRALVKINDDEIKIASGDFHNRPTGIEFQDPKHFYCLDIDLFGRGSFFQYINRTGIQEGTLVLANALKANAIQDIKLRQDAVKELSKKVKWRQQYLATSNLVTVETPAKHIINWLKSHETFLPKRMSWFPLVFGLGSVALFLLTVFGILSNPSIVGYWLFLGLGITGFYLKRINGLASKTDKVRDTFRQYAQLLDLIENESFSSELLKQKQHQIQLEDIKASQIFRKLSKSLDAFDNRNNIIGAIFGNGYFLTDLKNSYNIEKWVKQYAHKVSDWFEVVSFFDAYNTFGNFAFNHSDFTFPEIVTEGPTLKAEDLAHPLLQKEKRIASDVIMEPKQFFIVTGANMAGKSTFLRTVSLHIVMANVGLPICAKESHYKPTKLITSMRTSDSLTDDSSYFFSELTRLKFIVEALKKESYFIILDEILKGTNSIDKAIGSKKFVEKLVASGATGIIATHDLSLCEISESIDVVKNYYFDAEIINDELHFDYKFKLGICQNMNASFLLKKMEIV